MAVKFYQLFANSLRWRSLENLKKKKITKMIVRLTRERKKGRKKLNKQTNKFENLSDFQQIQVQFYQLFATVLRWSLENLKKIYQNYRSFDERGEERKKVTKSNAICKNNRKKVFHPYFCQFGSANSLI